MQETVAAVSRIEVINLVFEKDKQYNLFVAELIVPLDTMVVMVVILHRA